jgi:hypothetical protein
MDMLGLTQVASKTACSAWRVPLLQGLYLSQVGDVVQLGQLIGYEARIGNATGCHSHLVMRRGETTMNASNYYYNVTFYDKLPDQRRSRKQ